MMTTIALASLLAISPQDPMMAPIPKAELSAISYLSGRYSGKGTASDPTGHAMNITGTSSAVMEFDRWLNIRSDFDMGAGGSLNGRMLITYNSTAKKYEGVWFDNMSEQPLMARGYTEGKYLVLFSDEFEMMPGQKTIFKIVYSKESSKAYNFSMKMKAGDQWVPMMAMNYTKR